MTFEEREAMIQNIINKLILLGIVEPSKELESNEQVHTDDNRRLNHD